MAQGPLVRARHMKALLASVDRLPEAAEVRQALGSEALRAIEDSSGVEWLPIGPNLALSHALYAALGAERFDRFHREHSMQSFRGPLFRAVVDGAIGVFGMDPGSWTRFLPTAWSLAFRDCGAWSFERGEPGRVGMVLGELPPACVVDRVWPQSVAASLSAMVDLARAAGQVELDGVDAAARQIRLDLRWTFPGR